ncbi:hypothetical protein PHLCEN_2v10807 [Hermanssonia centrifuga]|uniref:Uncharacterized protein n=1 Tax=Hermanssonia centrifuga TaxID=98765 RepID=A0A2R6NLZ3_9APHY|nr:hypothetical protein PHLCEN_2v10807 [Hermanssonia centrifuga]
MRVTRSASRAAAAALDTLQTKDDDAPSAPLPTGANGTKRKTSAKDTKTTGQKKARSAKQEATSSQDLSTKPPPRPALDISKPPALVPAKLTFSFEEARQHLINADIRFEDIFDRMKCRPYEHLEQFDPFRLFDPSLPEKPKDRPESVYHMSLSND